MTLLGVKSSPISDVANDHVDVLEVAGWDLGNELPDRVLLHNLNLDFSLAVPHVLDDAWLERCRRALKITQSPWFSLHLGFSTELVRFENHMLPASAVLDRSTCQERMIDAVSFACRNLNVPVLIENLDYCPEGAYEHVCDPKFIAGIVEASGCGLLLDLAHLQVSADWLGFAPEEYASQLPMDRVVEVHLSSPRRVGVHLDDGHFELLERDVRLLEWTLERCEPRAVVLEYTRDRARLPEQLQQIRAVLDRNAVYMGELPGDDSGV